MIWDEIMVWGVSIGVPAFVLSAIVLYIKNRIEAKKEGRKINRIYIVGFIISMAIIVLFVMGCAFVYIYRWIYPKIEEYEYRGSGEEVHAAVLKAMMEMENTDMEKGDGDYYISKKPYICSWCKEEKSGIFYRIRVEGTSHSWICEECYQGPYKDVMDRVREAMNGASDRHFKELNEEER